MPARFFVAARWRAGKGGSEKQAKRSAIAYQNRAG